MLKIALVAVFAFIGFVTLIALSVRLSLFVFYIKNDRCDNSVAVSGNEVSRKILNIFGLNDVNIKQSFSLLFGNRYSRRKKCLYLRSNYYRGRNVASLAMGAARASFIVLDKEGDKAVKRCSKFSSLIGFGPIAYIPIVILGAFIDFFFFQAKGFVTEVFCGIGTFFYLLSVVLALVSLRAEKNAQIRAYEILREQNIINEAEMEEIQKRFKLFNFQYVNDVLLSVFEFVYDVIFYLTFFFTKKEKDRIF